MGRERLIATTGSPAVTAFTSTKLLWVRRHEPDLWAEARHALLAKDFLRLRLTGKLATDPTDAGATGLLDVGTRRWSLQVLDALEIPPDLLPEIRPSTEPAGNVTREAAAATGLRAGTPVATGAGDQECAALGCGVLAPGPVLITLGTGGQVFAATSSPLIDQGGRVHSLPHLVPTDVARSGGDSRGGSCSRLDAIHAGAGLPIIRAIVTPSPDFRAGGSWRTHPIDGH